ncbi:hypothetical protein NDU88_000474 [Pleurodeles waltl]|uniref:Uncharacterized protein n=1 Tax=Pleurodeles waltl TaxID=8319 RepID=A0AAV7MI78_PLEWA|nr:hypothetical protein NDU88_000474 [Pleurodeles waltl]
MLSAGGVGHAGKIPFHITYFIKEPEAIHCSRAHCIRVLLKRGARSVYHPEAYRVPSWEALFLGCLPPGGFQSTTLGGAASGVFTTQRPPEYRLGRRCYRSVYHQEASRVPAWEALFQGCLPPRGLQSTALGGAASGVFTTKRPLEYRLGRCCFWAVYHPEASRVPPWEVLLQGCLPPGGLQSTALGGAATGVFTTRRLPEYRLGRRCSRGVYHPEASRVPPWEALLQECLPPGGL